MPGSNFALTSTNWSQNRKVNCKKTSHSRLYVPQFSLMGQLSDTSDPNELRSLHLHSLSESRSLPGNLPQTYCFGSNVYSIDHSLGRIGEAQLSLLTC